MSDIVERLRTDVVGNAETDETSLEAANEIERLRAALREIMVDGRSIEVAQEIAREALGDD